MNPFNPYYHGFFPHDNDGDSEGSIPPEIRDLFRSFFFSRPEGENPNVRRRIGRGNPNPIDNGNGENKGLDWGREEDKSGNVYLRAVDTFILVTAIGREIQKELQEKGLIVDLTVIPNGRGKNTESTESTAIVKLLSLEPERTKRFIEDRQYITDTIRIRLGCADVVGMDRFGKKLFESGFKPEIKSPSFLPSSFIPDPTDSLETTTGKESDMTSATLTAQENNIGEYVPEQTVSIVSVPNERIGNIASPSSRPSLTFGQFIANCERAGLSRDFIDNLVLPDGVERQMRESLYSGLDAMIFAPIPSTVSSPSTPRAPRSKAVATPIAPPSEKPRKKPGRKPKGEAIVEKPVPSTDEIRGRMMMFPKDFKAATNLGKKLTDRGETVYTENLRRALTVNGKPRNMNANLQRIADGTEYAPWWEKLMNLTPGEREDNEPHYREAARWLLSRNESEG